MTTKDEALDLALEALRMADELEEGCGVDFKEYGLKIDKDIRAKYATAITAIKQARSAPVQESEKRECMNCAAFGECNPNNDAGRCGYEPPAAQRQWVGLTDEEENALIPDPDGSAEANVRRVEVLPGAWGTEYEEVDAWSKPLVLQMLRDHEAKLKEKNT